MADALVQSEAGQGDVEKIAEVLELVVGMSEEELDIMLAELDDNVAAADVLASGGVV